MRIILDMQGAQAENRFRGIGRYTLSFAQSIARNRGEHEVILALNGLFSDSVEAIRSSFDGLLPQDNIKVWTAPGPLARIDAANDWRRKAAELIREAFLASLKPDVVHIGSLFEGLSDDVVTSIGLLPGKSVTAVTLHDLIPLIYPDNYLKDVRVKTWYQEKIEHLRRADIWLAVSESSRREGLVHLGLPESLCVNASEDVAAQFRKIEVPAALEFIIREKYRLPRPFVMYTGGIDFRKNIEGLIRSFGRLPESLRKSHQLAIVCSVDASNRSALLDLVRRQGLTESDVVLTGFVPDEDLVALYNLCTLFVFPSLHEGFGLPALEAMRCGAPVIGANTSSVPEVIGWEEALFDPRTDQAIAAKMYHALSDENFRKELAFRGIEQAKLFSWDKSARCAIDAMERGFGALRADSAQITDRRLKLAYVSPLPPLRTGIADYSAQLLPELARTYDIDLIIAQDSVSDPWVDENCVMRTPNWLKENSEHYDRVLYNFGNSEFHQYMFNLLDIVPGVVVLHDFYLSGVLAYMETFGFRSNYWIQELYHAHGYPGLRDRFIAQDSAKTVYRYPCSLSVIQNSIGVISHSENALRLAQEWYQVDDFDWATIPLLREPQLSVNTIAAREKLKFSRGDFLVCAFGMLGRTKLNDRLLEAWSQSSLANDKKCHLIFVGENDSGEYGRQFLSTLQKHNTKENLHVTGWVDAETFRQYLAASDIAVQLRSISRGETSAAVLDCMNFGIATIVNANGSMADLAKDSVWMLPDEFADVELVYALETLRHDEARRIQLGVSARNIIARDHDPKKCAELYCAAIEGFYRSFASSSRQLPPAIGALSCPRPTDREIIQLADTISKTFPPRCRQRQLLVDVSELIQRDAGSGIQRAVRHILEQWLEYSAIGYRVEPVYATRGEPYRYARRFTSHLLNIPTDILHDEFIDFDAGDIFYGLDLQPHVVPAHRQFFREMRLKGVKVKFAVYDLLCVLLPQYFVPGAADDFSRWLDVVAESDGAICISRSVADDLSKWMTSNAPIRLREIEIGWNHLGADFGCKEPKLGLPPDAYDTLDRIRDRPSFLMVGTLEPRKAHAQVLDAFDQLWQTGLEVNLVIVGKQGWMVEMLAERLHVHPERGKRLFWLDKVNDQYLQQIYADSTCLIAASYGEGFGLPLIEASRNKLPILARDIPVFREVADNRACYFTAPDGAHLVEVLLDWLDRYRNGDLPASDGITTLSWRESAAQHIKLVLGQN